VAKREFCQLAHKYNPTKFSMGGWFMSEKLDGMRGIWDGGVTRGVPKDEVPWANNDKDERYVTPPIATGLWSRLGNVIHAPDYFLDALPPIPCDGELYMGKNNRQLLMSIVKDLTPGPGWRVAKYCAFDLVPPETWLADGIIKTTNFKKTLTGCYDWWLEAGGKDLFRSTPATVFQTAVKLMEMHIEENDHMVIHPQYRLPDSTDWAEEKVKEELEAISIAGGEGLMVRAPNATYDCCRSHKIQKVKKLDDAEGTVEGYITGRRTDLGSKLLGKMGALILRLDNGKRLELSGFTDAERELAGEGAEEWACEHPETEVPDWIEARHFPRGCRVTFKYRGLTDDKIPNEARYWRLHDGPRNEVKTEC